MADSVFDFGEQYGSPKGQNEIYVKCEPSDNLSKTDPILCNTIYIHNNSYYHNEHMQESYDSLVNDINNEGTISPSGKTIDTPKGIKLELTPHQKRTLYEMVKREDSEYRLSNGKNVLFLCDNVGSGKSIEILSLLSERPMVSKMWGNTYYMNNKCESYYKKNFRLDGYCFSKDLTVFSSNLLIVPHNIFHQWIQYINNNTSLTVYGIDRKSKIPPESKLESVMNGHDIICVKSTMFKEFNEELTKKYGSPTTQYTLNNKKNNDYLSKDALSQLLNGLIGKFSSDFTYCKDPVALEEIVQRYKEDFKIWEEKVNYGYL